MFFLIIGLFHPIVIKSEYYVWKKIWPFFSRQAYLTPIIIMVGVIFCFINWY
ncbi:MAG: DUF4491 family protein [Peptococcaceae bacterium]|nr:DUF4491 family protein [Peptococcaceae bacterium]